MYSGYTLPPLCRCDVTCPTRPRGAMSGPVGLQGPGSTPWGLLPGSRVLPGELLPGSRVLPGGYLGYYLEATGRSWRPSGGYREVLEAIWRPSGGN